ncbi:DUF4153 domain-containing protein [Niallia sp. NCCP-28]|uniref:DUF4153 domain-containing protein n=1 Tax=Niallia sp. NCCP-28 TaxID=2934712 RepID=UPI00208003C2|nr:DUF4173 domain-containing protein [Niallia sp. NCCP-28]GKU80733.1 hypothetical protein NCCP28_01290 [Niallia sp. NCCP-28]
MKRKNIIYSLSCLLLSMLAEISLFTESIGISFSLFFAAFYFLFYAYIKKRVSSHKFIGMFLFCCIWVLILSYVVTANPYFYSINFILIIGLVCIHACLITSPPFLDWSSSLFLQYLGKKAEQFCECTKIFGKLFLKQYKKEKYPKSVVQLKKVIIGLIIAAPIVVVMFFLLSSSDENFVFFIKEIVGDGVKINANLIWQGIRVIIFCVFFILAMKTIKRKAIIVPVNKSKRGGTFDHTIVLTVLFAVNSLYLLFTIVQFRYFFNDVLMNGYSFSAYARRGFFELIIVSIINLLIILCVNTYAQKKIIMLKSCMTLLTVFSLIMLLSSHLRLSLYEEAYGYTYLRLFAHSFLLLLAVAWAFTIIKIWIEKLNLIRIFIIIFLVYYCTLTITNLDGLIVKKNIERFSHTGQFDIPYMKTLSDASIPPLVDYYKQEPHITGLKQLLIEKKQTIHKKEVRWQSYNLMEAKAKKALKDIKE